MKIYVGRWDLLPKEMEGINGLYNITREEATHEVLRQEDETHDRVCGIYFPHEFEDLFNQDLTGRFNNADYWIKIF